MADRAALDTRIAQLHQTIGTLTKLCGFTPTVPFGLTDACRVALRGAGRPMTAVDVRDRLGATGYDLEKYANPLAAIHTVLKRLREAGEATSTPADASSRTAFSAVTGAAAVGPKPKHQIPPHGRSTNRPRGRAERRRRP